MSLLHRCLIVLIATTSSIIFCDSIAQDREGSLDDNGGVTFLYSGLPLRIPPGIGGGGNADDSTRAAIEVLMPIGTIVDVEVQIDALSHTFDSDLDIYLESPAGTRVLLSSDNGGPSNDYLATRFQDGAEVSIISGVAPFTGNYRPEQALSAFDNENPNGSWTLIIDDDASPDIGLLSGWSIQILTTLPPPCPGLYTVSHTEYEFTTTYVGNSISTADIIVGNFSDSPVCITNITTTGGVWSVSPNAMILNPGDQLTLLVSFTPTFSHTFHGVIELFTDHPLQLRDSILVLGRACQPVQTPPQPQLIYSGHENMIYYKMPWDANDLFTDYALEYSSNGFVTSRYLDLDSVESDFPNWQLSSVWAMEGPGAIYFLEPSTFYQVRLHTRDCVGATAVGLPALMNTAPEIVVDSSHNLTVEVVMPDSVELRWDTLVIDYGGNIIPHAGFEILSGRKPDSVLTNVGYSIDGYFTMRRDTSTQLYFRVKPIIYGGYDVHVPVIMWPPDGAWLYGENHVMLWDVAHDASWDSFRIEMDSLGFPALLGSNLDFPRTPGSPAEVRADFEAYGYGPHYITATIVDEQGRSWVTGEFITIAPRPSANFDASFDPALNRFSAQALNYTNLTGNLVDTWWFCNMSGERTGSLIQFDYLPGQDSISLLIPFPQTDFKLWTDELEWPHESLANIGVEVPTPGQPVDDVEETPEELDICCYDMYLNTSGKDHSGAATLGPIVECKKERDTHQYYTVGYRFEMVIVWEVVRGEYNYSFRYDEKSTVITTQVECKQISGVDSFKVVRDKKGKAISDTTHHRAYDPDLRRYRDYPNDEADLGRGGRSGRAERGPMPAKPEVGQTVNSYKRVSPVRDQAREKNYDPTGGSGWREEADFEYLAVAKDECPGDECCRRWRTWWDVVFCPNCVPPPNELESPNLEVLQSSGCPDIGP